MPGVKPYLFIIGVSVLVHLPGLRSPLLDYHAHRQCQTASMARNYVEHGMRFVQPELDGDGWPKRAGTEFPLYSYLIACLYNVFGVHEALGRLLSCLFAAWGGLYLYGFLKRRVVASAALASALVMSVIPIHTYFTRTVQPEPMALWGLLGFLYHTDRWLREQNPMQWLLALMAGVMAPLLKLNYLYLVFPLGLYLGWEAWREKRSRAVFGVIPLMLAIVVLPVPWYLYARSAPTEILPLTGQDLWENTKAAFTWTLWRKQFISWIPEVVLTYAGLVLAMIGWRCMDTALRRWVAAWSGISVLYVVLLGNYGVIHRYTLLPLAPLAATLIGVGILQAWRWAQGSRIRLAAVTVLVLGIPVHTALRIKNWYRVERTWLFEAREVIRQQVPAHELLLVNTRETPVHLYYLNRYGYAVDLDRTGWKAFKTYHAQGVRYLLSPTEGGWARRPEWVVPAGSAQLLHSHHDYVLYRLTGADPNKPRRLTKP